MTSILVLLEKKWYKPYGGAELATHQILKLLSDEGFDITVITGIREFNVNDIKYFYSLLLDVPSKVHLWMNLFKKSWLSEFIKKSDILYIPRLAYPVILLAKKYKKKIVVHLHDYQPITYCSAIFSYNDEHYNANFLSDIRRSLKFEIFENKNISRSILSSLVTPLNRFCRVWLSKADRIICVSHRQNEIIESAAPELSDKLKVIYNPLPKIPLIKKRLEETNIMYLGGDSYVKGFHVFLNTSQKVLKQNPNVKFLITGVFRNASKLAIKKLNARCNKAYNLLGYLMYKEVLNLHSVSRALLFPSIWEEPLPYAVLEAMLAGTIVIASKVGGVPEIVQGTFTERMLFEPGNVEECVDRIESMLAMSNEQIIDRGYELRESMLKKFDSKIIKKKLIEVFSL